MRTRRLTPLLMPLAALMLPALAHAGDTRLADRLYDKDAVVRIEGRLGVQATISFGTGETIENVAVGDSASWQIAPSKRGDLLFVKPLATAARTNMTVVTDRHTYMFELVGSRQAPPLYMLRFSYKDEPAAAAPAPASPLDPAERLAIAGDPASGPAAVPAAGPADPAQLDFAWARKGDAGLQPAQVYDDGSATFLAWRRDQPIPAILVLDEKGAEGPVNYAVRGNIIVLDQVPATIVLRFGKRTAMLSKAADVAPALADASLPRAGRSAPAPWRTNVAGR